MKTSNENNRKIGTLKGQLTRAQKEYNEIVSGVLEAIQDAKKYIEDYTRAIQNQKDHLVESTIVDYVKYIKETVSRINDLEQQITGLNGSFRNELILKETEIEDFIQSKVKESGIFDAAAIPTNEAIEKLDRIESKLDKLLKLQGF